MTRALDAWHLSKRLALLGARDIVIAPNKEDVLANHAGFVEVEEDLPDE